MTHNKVYTYMLSILVLCGCSGKSKNNSDILTFKKFSEEIRIEFEEIKVADELYFVGDILLLKDALVTLDMKNSPFFQLFELPDFNYLGGFTKQGSGPEEEVMIIPKLTRLDNNTFYYRTVNNIKIAQYKNNIKKIEIVESISLKDDAMELAHAILLGDYIYGYGLNLTTKKEYIGFSRSTGKKLEFGPEYPSVNMNIRDSDKASIFTKVLGVQISGGSKFAALYDKFPILRIYGRDGSLIKDIRYENNQIAPSVYTEGNMNIALLDKTMINYLKIYVTDNYIYGLYVGKTHGELRTQELQVDDFGGEIHIWDWDGNPKAKLILPQNMFSFAVSLDDEYILFSSVRSEDKIFKFTLPDWK